MRALVTGAHGFCGGYLRRYLESQGVEVYSVGTRPAVTERHQQIAVVTDAGVLRAVLDRVQPDFVFHLAGVTASADPLDFFRINTEYAVALLTALRECTWGDPPVLLVGTSAEYGLVSAQDLPLDEERCPHPHSDYGISKLAQTLHGLAAARAGRPIIIVRPFNLIGPHMPRSLVLHEFALQVARVRDGTSPPVIHVGNIDVSRDFVDIRDAVPIFWDAVRTPHCYGEIINICSGRGTQLSDALATLLDLAEVEAQTLIEAARVRVVDIPAHFGSTAKLDRLLGPRHYREITTSLKDILASVEVS